MNVIVLTLLATFSIQLGYFFWKMAADTLPEIGKQPFLKTLKGFLSSGRWLLGTLATTVGWILFVQATHHGAISLVQPLMTVGDIFLILLAMTFLKERLGKQEWVGLIITILGAFGLSFENETVTATSIHSLACTLFFLSLGLFLVAALLLAKRLRQGEFFLALAVGICFGAGAVLTKLITNQLALSSEAGLGFWSFLTHPLFIPLVGSNVFGLILLQMAFQKGRAAVVIPIQLSVVNGAAVIAGWLIFSESISMYRMICIFLIVFGTGFLHHSKPTGPSGQVNT